MKTDIFNRKPLLACLIFILLLSVFFNQEIRSGKYLVAGNSIYAFHPWADLPNPEPRFQNFDLPLQFLPWRSFIHNQYTSGKIPLWNPYTFCGSTFIGNVQTQAFYPLDLPFILLSPGHSFLLSAMLKIFLACFGAFLLARFLGFCFLSSITTGVIYGFSGFIILWLGYPHSTIAAWAPWAILAIEKTIACPRISNLLFFATITAMHMLAGHPEMSAFLLVFLAVYTAIRLFHPLFLGNDTVRKHALRSIRRYIFPALILGLVAAAIIYLPFVEYLTNSMVYHAREHKNMGEASIPSVCLSLLFMPGAFGSPANGTFFFPAAFPQYGNSTYGEIAATFFGLWPLYLSFTGAFIALKKNRKLLPFLIIGLFTAMLLYGVPGLGKIIAAIPILNLGFILRAAFIVNLCGAILAGAGLDQLFTMPARQRIWSTVGTILYMAILMVVVNVFALSLTPIIKKLHLTALWNHETEILFCFLAAGTVLILAGSIQRLKPLTKLLPVIIFLELFRFGYGYNASVVPERVKPPHPVIAAIKSDTLNYRFTGLDSTFFPNMSMEYELDDIRGYDALTPDLYYQLTEAFDPTLSSLKDASNPAYMLLSTAPTNLLKLLNIRYLIYPPWRELSSFSPGTSLTDFVRPVNLSGIYKTGFLEYKDPLSRFYVCRDFTLFTNDLAELNRLTSLEFNAGREVTLRLSPRTFGKKQQESFFSIVEQSNNEPGFIVVDVESSQPALLASSESFYPGWKATVNNRPAEILRCNFAFKAVEIPSGKSKVIFRYMPVSYRLGAFFTLLALIVGVLLFIYSGKLRKRPVSG